MSKPIPAKTDPLWVDVPYLETTDRVIGGIAGSSNAPTVALHERTEYIKGRLDTVVLEATTAANAALTSLVNTAATTTQAAVVAAGVTATETAVATALASVRESVSVRDFGAVGDWNGSSGTDDSFAFSLAIAYATHYRKRLIIPSARYSVGVTGVTYTANSIDNLEIYFEPGVELVCTYVGTVYPFLFYLEGVGANVSIIGNGAHFTYANTPAARGVNHAMYLFGAEATITNLRIENIIINNSQNFGIAIYAGPVGGVLGGVSTGNKNVWVIGCRTSNTLGDGIHVENFDSGVHIVDSYIESPGDDSIVVSNYTGVSGAPTKTTPTQDVEIANVQSVSAYSAIVRLLGVQRCNISKLYGTMGNVFGGIGASAVSCDASTTDYGVGNYQVTVSNIEVVGGGGLFYWMTGAPVVQFKMSNATLTGGNIYGIRALGSNDMPLSLNDLTFENIYIEYAINSGASEDYPFWATYVRNLTVRGLKVRNVPSVMSVSNCIRVEIDTVQADFSGSTGSAFSIVDNINISVGRLVLDDSSTFNTGATFTNNINVWHTALWDFQGATTKLARSGNLGVRGACQRIEASAYLGGITAGTVAKQTLTENVFTGDSYQLQTTLISDQGFRWGTTGLAPDGFYVLYTDSMTNARINYVIETNIGY